MQPRPSNHCTTKLPPTLHSAIQIHFCGDCQWWFAETREKSQLWCWRVSSCIKQHRMDNVTRLKNRGAGGYNIIFPQRWWLFKRNTWSNYGHTYGTDSIDNKRCKRCDNNEEWIMCNNSHFKYIIEQLCVIWGSNQMNHKTDRLEVAAWFIYKRHISILTSNIEAL